MTVTGASPVVDMQIAKVGTDFTTDKLVGVPTATDVWAVLGQASGVRMQGFDVGGSHKSQQTGYESFGIRNQNRVLNDGVDTTEGTGGAGFYADFFANEEVAVSAAGGDVEMNSPGSAVVTTIKSGGNKFKMLNNLTYQQESFVGDNQTGDAETTARGYTGQPNIKFWEGHTDIGGPIKQRQAVVLRRLQPLQDRQADLGRAAQHRHRPRHLRQLHDEGNLEGVAEGHAVVGYYQWGRKQKPNRGLSVDACRRKRRSRRTAISWVYKGAALSASGRIACSPTSRCNLFGYDFPLGVKADFKSAAAAPRHRHQLHRAAPRGTRSTWRGRSRRSPRSPPTTCPTAMGSHDLKVGFEYLLDISQVRDRRPLGPDPVSRFTTARPTRSSSSTSARTATWTDTWTGANNRNQRYAGYVQDRWNPNNRTTFQLGVRWDYQRPYYLDGKRDPLIKDVLPASSSTPR